MADEANTPAPVMPWQEHYEPKENQAITSQVDLATGVPEVAKGGNSLPPWEQVYQPKDRGEVPGRFAGPRNMANIDAYLDKTSSAESNGVADAKNPNSSASGLYQFTDSTWNDAVKEAGKNYTLADRNDPVKAREIAKDFSQRNAAQAQKDLGRPPTNVELYMYHFLGRNGAGEFLNAPRDAPAKDYVTPGAARANKTIFYQGDQPRTVGDVINRFARKF